MTYQSKLIYNGADLIGTPFEENGRGPDTYDCWGLLMVMHRRNFGREIPDYKHPGSAAKIAEAMSRDMHLWRRVERGPGASILFKVFGLGSHVGFQIDPYRFIHTWEKSGGVLIERLSFGDWDRRIIGFYEYAGPL
jgi:cell wall-associated NlpC family hydrolase